MQGSTAQPRSRIASVAGLIVALGAAFVLPFLPGQAHQRITDAGQDVGVIVFEWAVAFTLLATVIFWERLPLRSIGFRAPSRRDFIALGLAFAAMYAGLGVAAALTHVTSSDAGGVTMAQIAAVPLVLRIVLFLTAGFCEELMLRAYAIERLTLFTGKLWIGGAVVVVLFTLAHVPRYGFSEALMNVAIIAVALTALYMWTRNFWVCAIMHAIIDCFGLIVGPALATHGHP
ncbi:MAG: protease family protein [Candidatus Eremiobacteraeota bacterium]|jgi:membrane protease YdiL (CAAX protease family)|nr:protease family protein [Candidatus Eremiobacteraeota bacterium]